jgi:hypothetical protein
MAYTEHPQSEMIAERWVGTLGDVADIADDLLASFHDAGDVPWHFYIAIEIFDGRRVRTRTYETVADFRADVPTVDPDLVREATISATIPRGNASFDDQHARVNFGRRVGVFITIQAPAEYEAFVDNTERRINRAVERRELPLVELDRVVDASSLLLAFAAVVVLETMSGDRWLAFGLVLTVLAAAVLLVKRATRWAFPPLSSCAKAVPAEHVASFVALPRYLPTPAMRRFSVCSRFCSSRGSSTEVPHCGPLLAQTSENRAT